MVTHDLPEGLGPGDRALVLDAPRRDPHDPEAFGVATRDLDARRGVIPFQTSEVLHVPAAAQ